MARCVEILFSADVDLLDVLIFGLQRFCKKKTAPQVQNHKNFICIKKLGRGDDEASDDIRLVMKNKHAYIVYNVWTNLFMTLFFIKNNFFSRGK